MEEKGLKELIEKVKKMMGWRLGEEDL